MPNRTDTPSDRSDVPDRCALDVVSATLVTYGVPSGQARRVAVQVLADLNRAEWLVTSRNMRRLLAKFE